MIPPVATPSLATSHGVRREFGCNSGLFLMLPASLRPVWVGGIKKVLCGVHGSFFKPCSSGVATGVSGGTYASSV